MYTNAICSIANAESTLKYAMHVVNGFLSEWHHTIPPRKTRRLCISRRDVSDYKAAWVLQPITVWEIENEQSILSMSRVKAKDSGNATREMKSADFKSEHNINWIFYIVF